MNISQAIPKARNNVMLYLRVLLSATIAVFACPMEFMRTDIASGIDSSWIIALNLALKRGAVFGREFIFTYGPLGFLSTRNGDYIGTLPQLVGDALLFAGTFYLIYKFLSIRPAWWPLIFITAVAMRTSGYSTQMFTLFIIYTALAIDRKSIDNTCLLFSSTYGLLLFFIKFNYGLISLPLSLLAGILIATHSKKDAIIYLSTCILLFAGICLFVHIDLLAYFKYSIPIVASYDEAMLHLIDMGELPIWYAIVYSAIILACIAAYLYNARKSTHTLPAKTLLAFIIAGACYLLFRNGFTRYDTVHITPYFSIFPIFFIGAVFIFDQYDHLLVKIASVCITLTSLSVIAGNCGDNVDRFTLSPVRLNARLSLSHYYWGILKPFSFASFPEDFRDDETARIIGRSTVDMLPHEISYMRINNLNYHPRPEPQAYNAYDPILDSINARHFTNTHSPRFVLINDDGVDARYHMWDESVTKAAIHTNYDYLADTKQERPFMLFGLKEKDRRFPVFLRLSERSVKLGDTVFVPHQQQYPVYMSINIQYTKTGHLKKLVEPMMLSVTLLTTDSTFNYTLVRPIVKGPVLVSHLVRSDAELKNFLTGEIAHNKQIKAFTIRAVNADVCESIKINFYAFKNY